MNILFLDYDGVVNTPMWQLSSKGELRCFYNFPNDNKVNNFQACQWVSELCEKCNYKIVVTSTWRWDSNYKECLRNGGLREDVEVIGKTPDLFHKFGSTRADEIQQYLDEHTEVENFLIADDDDDDLSKRFKDHFILCDNVTGFNMDEFFKGRRLHEAMENKKGIFEKI